MKRNKKIEGISLIVLVITIIVMIILAVAMIATLTNTNIINKASQASEEANLEQIKSGASVYYSEYLIAENTDGGTGLTAGEYIRQKFEEQGVNISKQALINDDGTVSDKMSMSVYAIRRALSSSSSAWERIEDSEGLVANATKNGETVINNFDSIYPWSEIKSYNYNISTGTITAWYGDANFKFDGSNGEVLTRIPEFYYKRNVTNEYEYIYISEYPFPGYIKSEEFSVGRYLGSLGSDNKLHSKSNTNPSTEKTITQHRNYAKALGDGFGQMDWRYFILQMLYLVEYADYNAQIKLGYGWSSMPAAGGTTAIIAENNTNRIVLEAKMWALILQVGQQIDIGTSVYGREKAKDRTIISIEDYDDGTVTGKAITFDGAAINVAVGNILYACGQKSGSCDSLGMKSGSVGLGTSKIEGVIYRGIEDFFGNLNEWVDGININNMKTWICKNPEQYVSDKFESPYVELGYINANSYGYVKELGYDANYPEIALPIKIGEVNNTYVCDYYFKGSGEGMATVGGDYVTGSANGPWSWSITTSGADVTTGTRLLKYK